MAGTTHGTVDQVLERERELERLYRERAGAMWHAVLAFSADPDVASDAVAEAFAQAFRRGMHIRDPERWLWRAAFKIAAGEMKRRRSVYPLVDSEYDMEEPASDLLVALRKLSQKQRSAVVLHHGAGYPVKQVATILGSTNAAVKVHLSRGRKRLRELLHDEEDE